MKRIADALDKANEPKREAADCPEGAEDRKSDLCAQWKAADAANSTVTIGWIGVALGAITMGAAIAAAIFAWRAVNETRRIGEAQVRAYLTIESLECRRARDGVSFKATVRNSGNSPALSAQIFIYIIHGDGSQSRLDPFEEHTIGAQSLGEFAECFWLYDITVEKNVIVAKVVVAYADVFGAMYKISDRFAFASSELTSTFTQMTPGRNLASYLRASQFDASPEESAQRTANDDSRNRGE